MDSFINNVTRYISLWFNYFFSARDGLLHNYAFTFFFSIVLFALVLKIFNSFRKGL